VLNNIRKMCDIGSLVVKVLDIKRRGCEFKSWWWQAYVLSLGKAFNMNFLTPPKCKKGYPAIDRERSCQYVDVLALCEWLLVLSKISVC
jgi:hypothetical protein